MSSFSKISLYFGDTSLSKLSAAVSLRPGATWGYVSRVICIEVCPSFSRTILGCISCLGIKLARVCLTLRNLITFRPTRVVSMIHTLLTVSGRNGLPSVVLNIKVIFSKRQGESTVYNELKVSVLAPREVVAALRVRTMWVFANQGHGNWHKISRLNVKLPFVTTTDKLLLY
jgi:hypothetical protein